MATLAKLTGALSILAFLGGYSHAAIYLILLAVYWVKLWQLNQ